MSGLLVLPFLGLGLAILTFPVLVLALLFVTLRLRRRVRALQARVEALEREVPGRPPESTAAPAPAPPAAPTQVPEPMLLDAPPGAMASPPPPLEPSAAAASVGPLPPEPRPSFRPAHEPAARGAGWSQLEGRLGGTWLNRVGALVLVLGIGFFLKYAFENDWIGPTGRVAIGLFAGVGLLLLGERLQRAAYRVPAQGLIAAGIATLYLSLYAAHVFYHLVAVGPAFAFMALVTATGVAIAIHHDARAIAVLANLGGFLTPVVLSTGTDTAVPLFTYLAILDAGLLASAYWRRWPELSLLSFAGTQLLYWGWLDRWYRPERLAVALVAASVFFALFALLGPVGAAGGWRADRAGGRRAATHLLILAAPTLYFLAARRVLAPDHTDWLALLCLTLAAAYLVAGQWAVRAAGGQTSLAVFHFAVALAYLTLTFAVRFTDHGTAIAWSVEGAVLLWGGFMLDAPKLRRGALVVVALGWGRWFMMLTTPLRHEGRFLLDHPAFVSTLVVVAATTVAAHFYRRHGEAMTGWEALARPLLIVVALGSAAFLVTDELGPFGPLRLPLGYRQVLTTVVWVVTAMPLLALARGDRTRVLLTATTLLLGAVGFTAVARDAALWAGVTPRLRPAVLNPRFLAGLLIVVLYWLYARVVPEFPHVSERNRARLGAVAAGASALFLLWNLSAEVMLMPLEGLPRGEAEKLRSVGLSVLWTFYAFAAMGVGMWRRRPSLRVGAIGLFGVAVAKVFLVDLGALDAVYRILSFLVLGVVLILASFLHTRFRRRSVTGEAPP